MHLGPYQTSDVLAFFFFFCNKAQSLIFDGVPNIPLKPHQFSEELLWTIWYHLYDLKNVKNTHGGVLLSVK